MLFHLRCGGHIEPSDDEVIFLLRISMDSWLQTKQLFIEKGFIEETNRLCNWERRQYESDSSAERVRKHREKQAASRCNGDETLQKRYKTVTVTPPDTDTDTDTEEEPPISPTGGSEGETDSSPSLAPRPADTSEATSPRPPASESTKQSASEAQGEFETFWQDYPKKRSKGAALKAWEKLRKAGKLPPVSNLIAKIMALARSPDWTKDGGKYIPYPASWLNAEGWNDEIQTAPVKQYSATTEQNIKNMQAWLNQEGENDEDE